MKQGRMWWQWQSPKGVIQTTSCWTTTTSV